MKRIVEGKRYDTETAEEIACYSNNLSSSDFRNCTETLYKTKNGSWFLHGRGGPLSPWSQTEGNTTWGDNRIKVLETSDAKRWLEENDFTDEVEKHFGDMIKDA